MTYRSYYMNITKQLRKSYQKKFDLLKQNIIERPAQGWIKTIRDFFGMTTTQLARKLNINQSRIVRMEKNEKNIKLSTLERIADALNCDFIYAFVPRENVEQIIYNQAKKKALKMLDKVNINMGLESQLSDNNETLEELIQNLINGNIARVWDEQ